MAMMIKSHLLSAMEKIILEEDAVDIIDDFGFAYVHESLMDESTKKDSYKSSKDYDAFDFSPDYDFVNVKMMMIICSAI